MTKRLLIVGRPGPRNLAEMTRVAEEMNYDVTHVVKASSLEGMDLSCDPPLAVYVQFTEVCPGEVSRIPGAKNVYTSAHPQGVSGVCTFMRLNPGTPIEKKAEQPEAKASKPKGRRRKEVSPGGEQAGEQPMRRKPGPKPGWKKQPK